MTDFWKVNKQQCKLKKAKETILINKLFFPSTYKTTVQYAIEQLVNETEYLMKNYGDRGAQYLHNSSYDTKVEFHNCFITHSKQFLVKYS